MISAEEIKTDHVNKMPQYYEVRGINNEADNKLFFSLPIVAIERRQPLVEHDMKTKNKKYSKLRIFWVNVEKGLGFALGKRMSDGGVDYMKVGEGAEWEVFKCFSLSKKKIKGIHKKGMLVIEETSELTSSMIKVLNLDKAE